MPVGKKWFKHQTSTGTNPEPALGSLWRKGDIVSFKGAGRWISFPLDWASKLWIFSFLSLGYAKITGCWLKHIFTIKKHQSDFNLLNNWRVMRKAYFRVCLTVHLGAVLVDFHPKTFHIDSDFYLQRLTDPLLLSVSCRLPFCFPSCSGLHWSWGKVWLLQPGPPHWAGYLHFPPSPWFPSGPSTPWPPPREPYHRLHQNSY